MSEIKSVFQSGIDNPCLSVNITDKAKNKIQSYLKTKINWGVDRGSADGVDGDLNSQIPIRCADSIQYITKFNFDKLEFVSDEASGECFSFIFEILKEANDMKKNEPAKDRMQDLKNRRGEDFARTFENALNSGSPDDLSDAEFEAHEKWVDENEEESEKAE